MWINTNERLPKKSEPVILSNIMDLDSDECRIAYLISNNKNDTPKWHEGNQEYIQVSSFKFWCPLLELNLSIPSKVDDNQLMPYLERYQKCLSNFNRKFLIISMAMLKAGNGFYHLDLYINGVVSRSLSLIYGFEVLVDSKNYMAASHLVRPHLDNYLRLYAAWQVDAPHDFAQKVMSGEMVCKMNDRSGKKMTDSHLTKLASDELPWIKDAYTETSGFVHFSKKHIFNTMKPDEKDHTIKTTLSKFDNGVTNNSKIEGYCGSSIKVGGIFFTHRYFGA